MGEIFPTLGPGGPNGRITSLASLRVNLPAGPTSPGAGLGNGPMPVMGHPTSPMAKGALRLVRGKGQGRVLA